MKIHFVTSEALPFSKTGGLADVIFGLSSALCKKEISSIVVSPLYSDIDFSSFEKVCSLPITMNWRQLVADIYRTNINGVDYFFIGNDYYFKREKIYGYDDEIERFAFFNLSYIEMIKRLNIRPDIVSVHDWETAMIPLLLKHNNLNFKTILTIHNPAFQGSSHSGALYDYFNLPYEYFENGTCRFHDYFSCLKTGIVTCDVLTTVSKTHAKELLNDLVSFNGLGHIIKLRKKNFVGITNGLDYEEFNPASDEYIEYPYDLTTVFPEKQMNQDFLLDSIRFKKDGAVFGIISRLTEQKGLDILPLVIDKIIKENAKLIVLGSGQPQYERIIEGLSKKYPKNIFYYCGYSNSFAHKIYASCDFLLMPSRYEPCGLSQLVAKRYGTIPIVSNVGGLVDTVVPYRKEKAINKADGIVFDISKEEEFVKAIDLAFIVYNDKSTLKKLIKNAMNYKSSWNDTVVSYITLYKKILGIN